MSNNVVLSLFEYTGTMLRPWAEAGFHCYAYDLQHTTPRVENVGPGSITFVPWDADAPSSYTNVLADFHHTGAPAMLFSFPPCTDLAGSGARHWKAKAERDPMFQLKAAARAVRSEELAQWFGCPFMVENPVGALSRHMGKPSVIFNPCDYGGYIPEHEAEHPLWPEYIAPRDAYKKKTCLWVGNGFVVPEPRPVDPVAYTGQGGSAAHNKLGGKSDRTKNIRSATPRGLAQAVFNANANVIAARLAA